MRREWRYLLLALMLLAAICSVAQDDDDDGLPQENESDNPASLSLNFNRQGGAYVSLSLPEGATDSETLPGILAQTLHCSNGVLKHPDRFPLDSSFQKNWSAAKRQRYREQLEQYNRRLLTGHCDGVLSRNGLLLSGDFDTSALLAELKRIGVDDLSISVDVPKTPFFEHSNANLMLDSERATTYLVYQFPLKEAPATATLHLAFGLRQADLRRALAILGGIILVPVLITLWMRRRALVLAKTNAAAAWFGFMRTLNWLVLGGMLFWMSSGLGARKVLEDWIFQHGFSPFGAAAADISLMLMPSFLIYLLCVSLSYAVHSQLRGTRWTRGEFLAQQLATIGAQVLPLMLGVSGIGVLHQQPELAAGLLVSAVVVFQLLIVLKLRLMKAFPQPLTTGDLRDRIFRLAGRLGVTVNQIFIVPSAKGQVANAYAAKNGIVMFTDYLLEHLNKREVDGIAAHELAHLRYKHPAKLGLTLIAVMFLPQYFSWLSRQAMSMLMTPLSLIFDARVHTSFIFQMWHGLNRFEQWPERDITLLVLGMAGFYLLSRHFENVADAAAVRLTGDAEAQITGILKVSRLNLTPIRWGKAAGSWLTHPATVQRVHRMASAGGLAPERLREILRQYESEGTAARIVSPEDRYIVPPASDPEKLRAALNERTRSQWKFWVGLMFYVLPPALVSVAAVTLHLSGWTALATYLAGMAVTSILIVLSNLWLGEAGYDRRKKQLALRFQREQVAAGRIGDIFVGFAPGPHPRIFGTNYHWDNGFLVLSKHNFQFVGEQVKFSFSPSEIDAITTGLGGPSWWKFERVYLRWKTADGHNGIFNLRSLEPGSIWRASARSRRLYQEILKWKQQSESFPPARPELAELKKLELGQVTSISPKKLGSLQVNLRVFVYLVPLAFFASMLLHAQSGYVFFSVLVTRVIQSTPYWRYRDKVPDFSKGSLPGTAPRAKGFSAGV